MLLDSLRDSPAILLGPYLDILAWNQLATAVFTDFAALPRRERNFLRLLFLDPAVRGRYVDWSAMARICVGYVRTAAEGRDDPRLSELIGDLSLRDPDFRTWWAERHATYQSHGTKTLSHPAAGQYALHWQTLRTPDRQQTLLVMTAPADSHSREVLRQLDASPSPSPSPPRPDLIRDLGTTAIGPHQEGVACSEKGTTLGNHGIPVFLRQAGRGAGLARFGLAAAKRVRSHVLIGGRCISRARGNAPGHTRCWGQ
jgi:MmyB-like transcription regulator ligand binding domain